ncbi:MAG: DUF4810 domain-containing protein [Deltaproteobacteria bacterium]|nr:MAG: DUF4810 domain-containing protein [Deltaproteobacteria bacterium]
MRIILIFLVLVTFTLPACAQNLYVWNNYDNTLYEYYKNPTERAKFIEALEETILKAEESGRVPPGIYAEYGYAQYEEGNFTEAVAYFQKEYDKWPESRILMAKMIRNAKFLSERARESLPPEDNKSEE